MNRIIPAVAAAAVLAACASQAPAPVVEGATATALPASSQFALAMSTAETLVSGGNTQTAIDRLTQLMGDTSLTREEAAKVLFERGQLKASPTGFDVSGAVNDFNELVTDYSDMAWIGEASAWLAETQSREERLNLALTDQGATRNDRFDALFELGRHQSAIDVMLDGGVSPSNDQLVAMFQIGYLCEGQEYTGPAYQVLDVDGVQRTLKFCDFGK